MVKIEYWEYEKDKITSSISRDVIKRIIVGVEEDLGGTFTQSETGGRPPQGCEGLVNTRITVSGERLRDLYFVIGRAGQYPDRVSSIPRQDLEIDGRRHLIMGCVVVDGKYSLWEYERILNGG